MRLDADDFADVEVIPQGVDLALRVLTPSGAERLVIDRPKPHARARWIADAAGEWTIELRAAKDAAPVAYELRWAARRKPSDGDRDVVRADSLERIADGHEAQGRFQESVPIRRRVVALRQAPQREGELALAASLDRLAIAFYRLGALDSAGQHFRRALAIRERVLPLDHPDVAVNLSRLGAVYGTQSRFVQAEPLLRRALAIEEKTGEGPNFVRSLGNMAGIYKDLGRYHEAEPLYRRALRIVERTPHAEPADRAAFLINLADLLRYASQYSEADSLARLAIPLWEKVSPPQPVNLALSLRTLAVIQAGRSRYAEAESLYHRSLDVLRSAFGPDSLRMAASLNGLATLYTDEGRFDDAEQLQRRLLDIRQTAFGPVHPDVAATLNNLGEIFRREGRYDEAEPLYVRAREIWEQTLEPAHPDVSASIDNLANLYVAQGRFDDAQALYQRSLSIREAALGPDHPDVAETLGNLAGLYIRQNRCAAAEPLARRSDAIREAALGRDHPSTAVSLVTLATCVASADSGRTTARAMVDRAIGILDSTPAYVLDRIDAYDLRSRLRMHDGDRTGGMTDLTEAITLTEALRPRVGGSDQVRAGFLAGFAEHFERMVAWQLAEGNVGAALEFSERGRARVLLDQLAAARVDLRQSIPSEMRAPLEATETAARARVIEYQGRLALLARTTLGAAERERLSMSLEDSLLAADRDFRQAYEVIKTASPLWRALITSNGRPVSLDTIQRRLVPPRGMMLVYQIGGEASTLFVIPPPGNTPSAVPLRLTERDAAILGVRAGPLTSAALEQVVEGHAAQRSSSQAAAASGVAELLADTSSVGRIANAPALYARLGALRRVLVPDSLWRQVRRAAEVVVVPGRGLYRLPFEALVADRGSAAGRPHYWLDDGPPIRYAASATTLYNIERHPALGTTTTTVGAAILSLSNPTFDVSAEPSSAAAAPAETSTGRGPSGTVEGAHLDHVPAPVLPPIRRAYLKRGGRLAPLPGTAAETEALRRAFGSSSVLALQGRDATESKLRATIAGRRLVHLATHGVVDDQRDALFAAFALAPPSKPSADDDGFLQLYEIYQLPLQTVDLAVLSACRTSGGAVVDGEGVFALSRGFHAAGARRVVGTGWDVQDRSTARLIERFFMRLSTAEKRGRQVDYSAALRDAKRGVREDPQRSHPYFWAAFVLSGAR